MIFLPVASKTLMGSEEQTGMERVKVPFPRMMEGPIRAGKGEDGCSPTET